MTFYEDGRATLDVRFEEGGTTHWFSVRVRTYDDGLAILRAFDPNARSATVTTREVYDHLRGLAQVAVALQTDLRTVVTAAKLYPEAFAAAISVWQLGGDYEAMRATLWDLPD